MLPNETEKVLFEILDHENDGSYWQTRFDGISSKEDTILRGCFNELMDKNFIKVIWADNIPYYINILKDGYLYKENKLNNSLNNMTQLDQLIATADQIQNKNYDVSDEKEEWLNDVQIYIENNLKNNPLYQRMKTILFHRTSDAFKKLLLCLKSISKEQQNDIIQKSNFQLKEDKSMTKYDVFISHANKDKESFVSELNDSLKKLGIPIFYDTETLEWGDNWKKKILEGTKKAEFAIIVISKNFFDREWTEKELIEFLNRQNENGQKTILPILHNISIKELQEKYPGVADIQAIDSSKYSSDEIALLFANQLIKRLKGK